MYSYVINFYHMSIKSRVLFTVTSIGTVHCTAMDEDWAMEYDLKKNSRGESINCILGLVSMSKKI